MNDDIQSMTDDTQSMTRDAQNMTRDTQNMTRDTQCDRPSGRGRAKYSRSVSEGVNPTFLSVVHQSYLMRSPPHIHTLKGDRQSSFYSYA